MPCVPFTLCPRLRFHDLGRCQCCRVDACRRSHFGSRPWQAVFADRSGQRQGPGRRRDPGLSVRPAGHPYEKTASSCGRRTLLSAAFPRRSKLYVPISGQGFDYSGAGSTPRAIFQFNPGSNNCTLEGLELSGAHNSSHNGARSADQPGQPCGRPQVLDSQQRHGHHVQRRRQPGHGRRSTDRENR